MMDDFKQRVDDIKAATRIEQIIHEDEPLKDAEHGRYRTGKAHDSLVVSVQKQYYKWNSKNETGDVFEWLRLHRGMEFKEAVVYLAKRAGIEPPRFSEGDVQAAEARRAREQMFGVAAKFFAQALRDEAVARDYTRGRGWTDETVQAAGLGYWGGNVFALRKALEEAGVDVTCPAAVALVGFNGQNGQNGQTHGPIPTSVREWAEKWGVKANATWLEDDAIRAMPGHVLVYPHVRQGRVTYLSTRGIDQKRHYNLPVELAGEKQVYFNAEWSPAAEKIVVVEGQADAVTLAQWNIAAVALCGCSIDEVLLAQVSKHKAVFTGLDNEDNKAVRENTAKIADGVGPYCRVALWPTKDANEWLQNGATADDCAAVLKVSPTWLEVSLNRTVEAEEDSRDGELRHLFRLMIQLDSFALAGKRSDIAKRLSMSGDTFEALLKTARRESGLDEHGRPQYEMTSGRTFRRVYDAYGNDRLDMLAHFTANIVTDVVEDDGENQERKFELKGMLPCGKPLPSVEVEAAEFAQMTWPLPKWGSQAVMAAGSSVKEHFRVAVLTLSKSIETRYDYAHTGWRLIDGKWAYLSVAGAVGLEDIRVRLSQNLHRYQVPIKPVDPVNAMKTSLRFIDCGDMTVTVPLWAAMYLAPLSSILPPSFTIWLFGTTGSMKSTATALAMCHFGTFAYNTPPASWTATANALEKMAFTLKDAPLWIDDFTSQSTLQAQNELRVKADQLLRDWGNRAGRTRMKADLSLRQTYAPRGLIISTAEQLPPIESIQSRLFQIEIAPGMLEGGEGSALTRAQLEESSRYAHAMAGYVTWLAGRMEQLAKELPVEFLGLVEKARSDGGSHLRLPANTATMYVGWKMGLEYASAIGAVSTDEFETLKKLGWDVLIGLGARQNMIAAEEKPVDMYFRALEAMFASGGAFLRFKDAPEDDGRSWPSVAVRAMHSDVLGWFDANYWYLIPEETFNAVCQFYRKAGTVFPDSERGLRSKLLEQKLLLPDGERFTYRLRLNGDDYRPRVLRIHKPGSGEKVLSGEAGTTGTTGTTGTEVEES
jgi:hypothetical protein